MGVGRGGGGGGGGGDVGRPGDHEELVERDSLPIEPVARLHEAQVAPALCC